MALKKKYSGTSCTVALLDDDPQIREFYHLQLQCAGFHSIKLRNLLELYDLIAKNPIEIILLDNFLKNESGISAIPEIMKKAPNSRVIVLTKSSSPDHVVEAIKNGAYDFINKDSGVRKILSKIRTCCPPVSSPTKALEPFLGMGFFGSSVAMLDLFQDIEKVAKHDINILITGETGTGKELVAKAVHTMSGKRSKRPMISVNCAAFSPSILEAEFFGARKGAFTDAKEDRKGIFEVADQSTLFLDEISDMPMNLQSKLLRAIQEQEIYPVGSTKPIKIDTRIIAATNKNLKNEIKDGRFRQDLYYRLSVLTLCTRPLRERKDDIKELANFFLNKFSHNFKTHHSLLSDAQLKTLQEYSWPGNVRELRNVIERSVLMSDRCLILRMENEEDGISAFDRSKQTNISLNYTDFKLKSEHAYLKLLMEASGDNLAEASRISGLHRPSIYRMLKRVKNIK